MQYEVDDEIIDLNKAELAYSNHGNTLSEQFVANAKKNESKYTDPFFNALQFKIILNTQSLQFAEETRIQLFLKTQVIFDALVALRAKFFADAQSSASLLSIFQSFDSISAAKENSLPLLGKQLKGILLCMDMADKPVLHTFADHGLYDELTMFLQYLPPLVPGSIRDGSMQWMTLFSKAAAHGNLKFVQFLLKQEKSEAERMKQLNQRDSLKMLPVHYACLAGQLEMVEFLLEKILHLDADVPTLISCCCQTGQVAILNYLLSLYKNKVKSFEKSKEQADLFEGKEPSAMACYPVDEQILEMLKSMTAGKISSIKKPSSGTRLQFIQILMKHNFSFTSTQLHGACLSNDLDLIRELAKQYPKLLQVEDENGLKPIQFAVKNINVFKCLTEELKVPVDYKGEDGAFLLCNSFQNLQVFKLLIEKGAPYLASVAENGQLVIHLACEQGAYEAVKYLLEAVNEKQYLLNAKDSDNNNLLHYAARSDSTELVSYLLKFSKEFKFEKNNQGSTPFHVALLNNLSTQVVLQLIEPDLVNEAINNEFLSNTYPLHHAVTMRDAVLAQALIDAGAKVNQMGGSDEAPETALQLLINNRIGEVEDVAMVLLKNGATKFDKQELLQLANEFEWKQVIAFLK